MRCNVIYSSLSLQIAENMELLATIAALREQLSEKSENSAGQKDTENSHDVEMHGECSVEGTPVLAKSDSQINPKLADENSFLQARLLQQVRITSKVVLCDLCVYFYNTKSEICVS